MADRGIIMSAPMVHALLREIEQPGKGKTQTRRLAWQQPKVAIQVGDGPVEPIMVPTIWQSVKPGGRLWVRETWNLFAFSQDGDENWPVKEVPGEDPRIDPVRAHYEVDYAATGDPAPWRPSIHMPRWASRITLLVEATKRERVQEINGLDAIAEGVEREEGTAPWRMYCRLWKSLHTKPGTRWEDNPEVVALTFRPVLANIDQVA